MSNSWKRTVAATLVIVILGTSYIWSKPVMAQKAEEKPMQSSGQESGEKNNEKIEPENPQTYAGAVVQGLLQYGRPDYSWREIRAYVMQRYREREKALEAMEAACRETLLEILEEYDQVLRVEEMQELMREACTEGLISRDMLACWENVLKDYCAVEVVGEVETIYEKAAGEKFADQ